MPPPQFVVWKDEYSVGLERLDAQHHTIFDLLNRLYEAIQEQRGGLLQSEVARELLRYTRIHFAHEERVMVACMFAERETHTWLHRELTIRTERLVEERYGGSEGRASELLLFIKDWWLNHIIGKDRKYVPSLAEERKSMPAFEDDLAGGETSR